ncbi:hypothetical protein [Providencia stuartii]|uniref:hypothetical protein n=1 Tax=Providencia stuartii TaxID=588 RepID=UPI000DE5FD1E|nr:hypothetical protein [Providencia stuartii]MDT1068343.1 hypothetical protein [Providencia stuartii]SST04546.1 Uncharacterised protein [Acinetobacter baumannii]
MGFITEREAEQALGDTWTNQTESDKARLLAQSEAYLIARNVRPYDDADDVPVPLKLASYEIIKGIINEELYQGQAQELKAKTVKGGSVEVSKTYQDGSYELNATEQYIQDLIKPYSKRRSVVFLKRV